MASCWLAKRFNGNLHNTYLARNNERLWGREDYFSDFSVILFKELLTSAFPTCILNCSIIRFTGSTKTKCHLRVRLPKRDQNGGRFDEGPKLRLSHRKTKPPAILDQSCLANLCRNNFEPMLRQSYTGSRHWVTKSFNGIYLRG